MWFGLPLGNSLMWWFWLFTFVLAVAWPLAAYRRLAEEEDFEQE